MVRKVFAVLAFAAALAAASFTAGHGSIEAGGKCAPGQHGNPHPGFKPGVC